MFNGTDIQIASVKTWTLSWRGNCCASSSRLDNAPYPRMARQTSPAYHAGLLFAFKPNALTDSCSSPSMAVVSGLHFRLLPSPTHSSSFDCLWTTQMMQITLLVDKLFNASLQASLGNREQKFLPGVCLSGEKFSPLCWQFAKCHWCFRLLFDDIVSPWSRYFVSMNRNLIHRYLRFYLKLALYSLCRYHFLLGMDLAHDTSLMTSSIQREACAGSYIEYKPWYSYFCTS